METIPDIGRLLGHKYKEGVTTVRCQNWYGRGKVSYSDITVLETALGKNAVVFPYISDTGHIDVIAKASFKRDDDKEDERVNKIMSMITAKVDWSKVVWEVEEPIPVRSNPKRNFRLEMKKR
ncbi:unnamed protein product [Eruca vesicaria subsp. sativa]|uniref:Uncharacterized protein n=1 Tax=Eruca vesicaria subsp. sativa TaxID=29727 RepID=A0ABC8LV73_ERUVS|nr:unnamed protein product [Eruca vesicaria subsp. sativa]